MVLIYIFILSNTRMEVNPLSTAFYYPKDKKLYFFGGPDGKYYYIFQPKDGKVTSAELISNKFGKLPSGLNAAFVWNYDEKTYFFKGKYVYRYNYKTSSIEDGYPKTIAREFKGVPIILMLYLVGIKMETLISLRISFYLSMILKRNV